MFFRTRLPVLMIILISLVGLITGRSRQANTENSDPSSIHWTVETTYPVNPSQSNEEAVICWVFRVLQIQQGADTTWWHVEVRDSREEIPVVGTFELDPQRGRIRRIVIREMLAGTWREYPMDEEQPTQIHLQTFSPLPLDFASPMLGLEIAQSAKGMLLRPQEQKLDSHNTFRRTYRISATTHPADSLRKVSSDDGPSLTLTVRPVTDSKRLWQFEWRSGSPWWTDCRTMAYSARLVEVKGVGGK